MDNDHNDDNALIFNKKSDSIVLCTMYSDSTSSDIVQQLRRFEICRGIRGTSFQKQISLFRKIDHDS